MEPMIEAYSLRKDFRDKVAVRDVSFSVDRGEIFGFLGLNGAGKTTTIRMLSGQTLPTSGRCLVAGFDSAIEQEFLKPIIGVVSETQNLYERMSGEENLNFFANLYNVKKTRVQDMLELIHLQSRGKEKVETYSTGMKQRLLIARALLHSPEVLFLDEPTRGLDPASAREIKNTIKKMSGSGVTIFLTTHNMEEADELCSRVAFIKAGELMALDDPKKLKIQYGERSAIVVLKNGEQRTISLSNKNFLQHFLLEVGDCEIQTIHSQESTLEDVFIKLAGMR